MALSADTINPIDALLPEYWSRGNPVDILGDATAQRYADAARVLLKAREVQGLLVMLAPQAMIDATDVARVLSEQLQNAAMPVLTSWMGGVDVENGRKSSTRPVSPPSTPRNGPCAHS